MKPEETCLFFRRGLLPKFVAAVVCLCAGGLAGGLETPDQFGTRLKRSVEDVNRDLDVEGLCRGFPKRLRKLEERDGGRLKH